MVEKENEISLEDDLHKKNNHCLTTINLQKCLMSSVENILFNVTDDKFVRAYKSCYKEFEKKEDVDRPSLSGSSAEARKYRKQFNAMILRTVSEVVDETLSGMDKKMRKLEELKMQQADSTVFWRPPGNVADHMIPFEYLCQSERKKELESRIEKEQEALNIMKPRLLQKRAKARELHEELLSAMNDIKKLVTESEVPVK